TEPALALSFRGARDSPRSGRVASIGIGSGTTFGTRERSCSSGAGAGGAGAAAGTTDDTATELTRRASTRMGVDARCSLVVDIAGGDVDARDVPSASPPATR